jgi:hypothetical protein
MGASAFVLGFFVALGGWTATKLTKEIDLIIEPPKIEATKPVEVVVKDKIQTTKEKENE